MSWDPVWEQIFATRDWGRYPQEDVVRFIARSFYTAPDRSAVRVLEVGCGPGSGASWFVAREGFTLCGIDGSETAIEKARRRFEAEGLRGEFVQGDIAKLPWPDESFDAVLDVGCLGCNAEEETCQIVREISRVLKPGGHHFSFTMKAGSWGDGAGKRLDPTTWTSVSEGPYAGMGKVRFATEASLQRIYRDFADLSIEYLVQSAANRTREVTHWVVTCRKP